MGKGKQRKWEELYERLSQEGANAELVLTAELETEYYEKNDVKKENAAKVSYDINQKAKKIINNINKVKNILELREKLEASKKEIEEELNRRKSIADLERKNQELENEMERLNNEYKVISTRLKDKDLSTEGREMLQQKLSENYEKRQKNNQEFSNNTMNRSKISKLSKKETPELEKESIILSTKISQCNMACNNLMKGYSWDSVDLKLQAFKGQTLTAKEDKAEKIKKIKEAVAEQYRDEEQGFFKEEEQPVEDNSLVEISEFDQKHPRLAKVKNWFKRQTDKLVKYVKRDDKEEDKEESKEKIEDSKEDTGAEFRKYLKEVADKGISGVEQEKREEARKKLEANRAAASAREPGEEVRKRAEENAGREPGDD